MCTTNALNSLLQNLLHYKTAFQLHHLKKSNLNNTFDHFAGQKGHQNRPI